MLTHIRRYPRTMNNAWTLTYKHPLENLLSNKENAKFRKFQFKEIVK